MILSQIHPQLSVIPHARMHDHANQFDPFLKKFKLNVEILKSVNLSQLVLLCALVCREKIWTYNSKVHNRRLHEEHNQPWRCKEIGSQMTRKKAMSKTKFMILCWYLVYWCILPWETIVPDWFCDLVFEFRFLNF